MEHRQTAYQTYIFDLDGTLLDTLTDLCNSCDYALAAHGLPERTQEEVRRFVGNGVRKLIERAVPAGMSPNETEKVLSTFREHYLLHGLDTTKPYIGVQEMLRRLQSAGCNIAVVSNKFDAATKELCRHFFPDTVAVAIGEREGICRKPAPDTVLQALKDLHTTTERAVYIGDSDVDIATARHCSLPCISVLWGFRDKDFLLRHGATTLVSSPEEIV